MITSERKDDLEYLKSIYRKVPPEKRREIDMIAARISNEPKHIQDMRKELVRAMRDGRSDNVKDINEYVRKNSKYQNG